MEVTIIFQYYEYVLAYVNDILAILHKQMKIVDENKTWFTFKNSKVEEPDSYLRA